MSKQTLEFMMRNMDETEFKLHVAKSNGNEEPFDVLNRDFNEWQSWNEYRGAKNRFNRTYIFSIIHVPGEKDTYVFGGIFKVVKTFDDHYEIELHPEYIELIGNLLINFHFTIRGSSFRLEGNFEKMYVK